MAMHQGNWTCSSCGGAITELPFQPRSDKGLTCRTCYAKGKAEGETPAQAASTGVATDVPDIPTEAGIATEPPPLDDAFAGLEGLERHDSSEATGGGSAAAPQKPQYEGSWPCSACGGTITSLPFEPRSTTNLKCLDCFKAGK